MKWSLVIGIGLSVILAAGCGDDDGAADGAEGPDAGLSGGPVDPFPEHYCPGSAGCSDGGDGVFRVGAARASIVPELVESDWEDDNGDGTFDGDEAFTDVNGNGEFDAWWMAGFGTARPVRDVNDDTWVRAIVFEYNDVRVALASIDAVGWFISDAEPSVEMLPEQLGIDHLIIAATHNHEGIDTIGMWGKSPVKSGVDPDYVTFIQEQTVAAVADAVGALEPVTMSVAQVLAVDEDGSSLRYVGDRRDPVILDPTVTLARFASVAEPERTVASLVHWSAHPEYAGSRNNSLSSDYPNWLRDAIENGVPATPTEPELPGLGGEVVFVNGPIGGQIGDNKVTPVAPDGTPVDDDGLQKSAAVGIGVGRLALQAMSSADEVIDVPAPTVAFRTGRIWVIVENTFFHVGGLVGIFNRPFFGYDQAEPIDEGNYPYLPSRVTYLQVGNIGMVTAPGELDPQLAVGGYDGSLAYGDDFIDLNNELPPDLGAAPPPPYLHDLLLENDGVEVPLVIGMAEDYLGYIVPAWNYILDEDSPYIDEYNGNQHYEETLSVGPLCEEQIVGSMKQLVRWRPLSQ